MLKAICDRCSVVIPDYDAERDHLSIIDGRGFTQESFDLCAHCLLVINDKLSDFIRGA